MPIYNLDNQEERNQYADAVSKRTQYEEYVATVKRSIDQAVEDGILRDCSCEGYSYLTERGFAYRMETDEDFAELWGDKIK